MLGFVLFIEPFYLTCLDQELILCPPQNGPIHELILRSFYQHVFQYVLTQHFLSLCSLYRGLSTHVVPVLVMFINSQYLVTIPYAVQYWQNTLHPFNIHFDND